MGVVLPHKLKPCGMVWRGPWSHISQIYVLSSRSRDSSSVILAPKNAESSASRKLAKLRSGVSVRQSRKMKEGNDDIVIEDDPDLTAPTEAQKKLREKLKQAEVKAKEYLDGWQRAQADFANLRRRDEEAKFEFIKFARLSLIEELIPEIGRAS